MICEGFMSGFAVAKSLINCDLFPLDLVPFFKIKLLSVSENMIARRVCTIVPRY